MPGNVVAVRHGGGGDMEGVMEAVVCYKAGGAVEIAYGKLLWNLKT